VFLFSAAGSGTGTCGPLLNEVMGDPARDWDGDNLYSFRADEWVEVVNPGGISVSLDGVLLADELGHPVYGFSGSLAPHEVRVVFGSESTAWESAHGEAATGLRLGNEGDTVLLKQVVGADTLVIDAYTYTNNEAEDDRSSGRLPDGEAAWQLFDSLNPYTGSTPPPGNGLPPTPGALNTGEPPTGVESDTWGRIKALYRTEAES
jgi:hypothetical protein